MTFSKLFLMLTVGWMLILPASAESIENDLENLALPTSNVLIDAPVKAATVYINYKYIGETPLSVDLPEGSYNIRISTDGYTPFVRRVKIRANQDSRIMAEMERNNGSIEIQSNVPGAEITISNGARYILPIRLDPLISGTYGYTIEAPNHEPIKGTFVFSPGKNIFIYDELESSTGLVSIDSTPQKAKAYIDDHYVGKSPVSLTEYPPGDHTVMLKKFTYAKVFRQMDTSLGNKGNVASSLNRKGARLVVLTRSRDAHVIVEGYLLGEGRWVFAGKLEPGLYDLEIDYTDREPIVTHIDIPVSGSVRYKSYLYKSEDDKGDVLAYKPALYRRWALWGAVAGVGAGIGLGSYLYIRANQPEPAPEGDTTLTIP
ncbi:MAG: PEGA domain-containing protein [Myxococcota bacterium]